MSGLVLCRLEEIEDGRAREVRVTDRQPPVELVLVRRGDVVHAYHNVCPHAGRALNWAPDRFLFTPDGHLVCAAHGATFEVRSGKALAGPCVGARLTRFPVVVEDGEVRADLVRADDGA